MLVAHRPVEYLERARDFDYALHGAERREKEISEQSTYELVVLHERAEVDEDVLWGAVEEPRVAPRPLAAPASTCAGDDAMIARDMGRREGDGRLADSYSWRGNSQQASRGTCKASLSVGDMLTGKSRASCAKSEGEAMILIASAHHVARGRRGMATTQEAASACLTDNTTGKESSRLLKSQGWCQRPPFEVKPRRVIDAIGACRGAQHAEACSSHFLLLDH